MMTLIAFFVDFLGDLALSIETPISDDGRNGW